MKKWLCFLAALGAAGILSRLPHPAQDIAKLDPVQAVYICMEDGAYHIQTDTGDHGSGGTLTEAEADLRANASKEVYLDTAEFLLLAPDTPIAGDFFTILSPYCYICYTQITPDLPAAADYLSAHTPTLRLTHLRVSGHK